jgi:inorganic triphosphatase YgiF
MISLAEAGGVMPTEIELKLCLDAAGLRRLRRHPLIQQLKQARPLTRFQKSVYFDTPDFQLKNQKTILRVRHLGRRRIQTVKDFGVLIGGARARGEWENDIIGDEPDLSILQAGALAPLFADTDCHSLQPVFTSEIKRCVYRLGADDWQIELALDEGLIVSACGSVPISEAELELKQGQPRHLFDLALKLQQDLRFFISTATKADRGYALLDGKPEQSRKASSTNLDVNATAKDAFRAIARGCLEQFLVNQACLIDSQSAEALHQMRISLRRLRSAISTFKGFFDTPESQWLKEELAWLLAPLGAARDSEVFFKEIFEPLASLFGEEPGFALLRDDFLSQRQETYASALALQNSPRLTRLLLFLGRWIEAGDWLHTDDPERLGQLDMPARQLAESTLARIERKVSRGMNHLGKSDSEARHETRIQVKKLRYTIDFFYTLFPRSKIRRLGDYLAVLQDRLGRANDIAVGRQRLTHHAHRIGDPERLWTAGMIAGWQMAQIGHLLKQASDDWHRYDKHQRFWTRKN